MRPGIIEAEREEFEVAGGAVGFDGSEVGAAVPDLAGNGGALHLGPLGGTGERMDKAPDVHFPGTEVKVEIVLAVAGGRGRRRLCAGGLCAGAAGLRLTPLCVAG